MNSDLEKQTKTMFKAIFAWQDEKEEKWLEEMAAKGWHLQSVAPYFYSFRKGNPEKFVYRMDYKNSLDKDYADYKTIFNDSGWELVATMSNWHYYRIKPENSTTPEIYNSDRAKAQKYRRLLFGLLPVMIIFFVVLNPAFRLSNFDEGGTLGIIYNVAGIIRVVFVIFFIYCIVRILMKIKKLESQIKE